MRWRARPRSASSWHFLVEGEEGDRVGLVELDGLADRGFLSDGPDRYTIRRAGFLRGPFELRRDGETHAHAELRSNRRCIDLHAGDFHARLEAADDGRLDLGVRDSRGGLGSVAHDGSLARRVELELPPGWSRPMALFALWPALLLWRAEPSSWGGIS